MPCDQLTSGDVPHCVALWTDVNGDAKTSGGKKRRSYDNPVYTKAITVRRFCENGIYAIIYDALNILEKIEPIWNFYVWIYAHFGTHFADSIIYDLNGSYL